MHVSCSSRWGFRDGGRGRTGELRCEEGGDGERGADAGNPSLGIQFLTSNANAGLDWPVRLLVTQDDQGQAWAVYTDFFWIARRHRITDRAAAFKMASEVIASITSSVAAK
ncbi:MAG TPA: DUF302 domain-containing protein [Hyphomicrobiaceae bacterium]|nr:DUF302 domain-containing protein [Hyphomicrobiaceae bacterium]